MKNNYYLAFFLLLFHLTYSSIWSKEINISCLGGPSLISLSKMFKENPTVDQNYNIHYQLEKSIDLLTTKIIAGKVDMALIPTTLGLKLYNKGIKHKLVCSTVWGGFYLASINKIKNWNDLKGKEIYTIGRGLTPDIVLRFFLQKKGLDPNQDVTIRYLPGPGDLKSFAIIEKAKTILIPEPILSAVRLKNKKFNIIFDLQNEWKKLTHTEGIPQTSLFVRDEIINKHRGFLNKFLNQYQQSIHWILNNPKEIGKYLETFKIGLSTDVIEAGLPRMKLKFIPAQEVKPSLDNFLSILNRPSSTSVKGKTPNDQFYYKK